MPGLFRKPPQPTQRIRSLVALRTTLYLTDTASDLNPGAEDERLASIARGAGITTGVTNTVLGPTAGVQVTRTAGGTALTWLSQGLQPLTISGPITFTVWMSESNGLANVGAQVKIERTNSAGAVLSTVLNSEEGATEVAVGTRAAVTWTTTPTSTAFSSGDRLKITVLGNDGPSIVMAAAFTFDLAFAGVTASADGDSSVTFSEVLSFVSNTDAAAGNAAGTGTAYSASINIQPNAGNAAGTGTSFSASTSIAPNAGNAAGTGAANQAAPSVAPNAGLVSGTGTAYNATPKTDSSSGHAAGTGTAQRPSAGVSVNAGLASGTGAAFNASVLISKDVNAGLASGTGTAYNVSVSIAPSAGNAAGTGQAFNASAGVGPSAGNAAGVGAAFGASLSIAATAGNAIGSGTAYGPATSVQTGAGGAAGTGQAGGPSPSIAVNAGHASGTGQAFDATVTVGSFTNANAGVAAGSGSAFGATIAIAANAGNAVGTGQAYTASISYAVAGVGARKVRPVRVQGKVVPIPVTGTVDAVVRTPSVSIEGDVNDDEVVLELLASIL